MTLTQPTATQSTEAYIADLRTHLAPITLSEREDILREITAHIRDSAEAGTPIDTILARLGTPAQLAAEYRDGQLIRAASRSLSPIILLRATLRVATKGITGVLVCLLGFIGYVTGISLLLTGILKPFFPSHVGIFNDSPNTFGDPRHDTLGQVVILITLALVSGAIVLILTTVAIRAFLRLSQKVQRSL
jgi:uncharacterized membrane protein